MLITKFLVLSLLFILPGYSQIEEQAYEKILKIFSPADTVQFYIRYTGVADSVTYRIEKIPLLYTGYTITQPIEGKAEFLRSFDAYEEDWLGKQRRVGTYVDYKIFLGAPEFREKPRTVAEILKSPSFPCGEYRLSLIWNGRSVGIVQHIFRVNPVLTYSDRMIILRNLRQGRRMDLMEFCD